MKLGKQFEDVLNNVYYNVNHPEGFTGNARKLLQRAPEIQTFIKKYKRSHIVTPTWLFSVLSKWLRSNRVYTLHKQLNRKFQRQPMIAFAPGEQLQLDLADMSLLSKYNNQYKFLLVVICVFSRRVDVLPLKTKTPSEVTRAFKDILTRDILWGPHDAKILRDGCETRLVYHDSGTEFKGDFQKFLKQLGIKQVFSVGDGKAAIAERVIKTLKQKLYKWLSYKNTYTYIDILPALVHSYNNSYHRTLRCTPNDVSIDKNLEEVRYNLYHNTYQNKPIASNIFTHKNMPTMSAQLQHEKRKLEVRRSRFRTADPFVFQIGDSVRIGKLKKLFQKAYLPQQTEEVFTVIKRTNLLPTGLKHQNRSPVAALYTLQDSLGEIIRGRFYSDQLIKVDPDSSGQEFLIETILQQRKDPKTGLKSYLVKWKNFPKKFASWIPETQIRRISRNTIGEKK